MILYAVSLVTGTVGDSALAQAIVQTAVSLLSIAAGVGIAVWSFRRNRQSEHEQFVRDQKQAEWKEILGKFRSVGELYFPHIQNDEVNLPTLVQRFRGAHVSLDGLTEQYFFISEGLVPVSVQLGQLTYRLDMAIESLVNPRSAMRTENVAQEYSAICDEFRSIILEANRRARLDLKLPRNRWEIRVPSKHWDEQ